MADRDYPHLADDGIDRRGFLECMAWCGTAVAWTVQGGILASRVLGQQADGAAKPDFTFVQISDSHLGFAKEPNKDVTGTLKQAVAKINAMPEHPALLLHTGDLTHLSKPDEFDTGAEVLKEARVGKIAYVPGEHDVFTDDARIYLERYGKGTRGAGWHSFDFKGVHFIGLVNVMDLKAGGLGALGKEQLEWLRRTWPAWPLARRWSYLPTFHCGRYTRSGAGARKMRARHLACSSASAPSRS